MEVIRLLAKFNRLKDSSKKEDKQKFVTTDIDEKFTNIYVDDVWGKGKCESKSGPGSTLKYTRVIRAELPKLIEKYEIKKLFDAPCGDFNWMPEVLENTKVDYTGADVVREIIDLNKKRFPDRKFIHFDVTRQKFPRADLWFCRDCLFHLSYSDIYKALEKYLESGVPYVLTTSHIVDKDFVNTDIQTGGFRMFSLFAEPFLFPNALEAIDDFVEPFPPRKMYLWHRSQIVSATKNFKQKLKAI
jgi:hypothetical protein